MATTFTPPRAPSVGQPQTTAARVRSVPLGDGYSADSPDGINTVQRTVTVAWQSLSSDDKDAIVADFVAAGGVTRLSYTMPGDASALLWVCRQWVATPKRGGRWMVTAQFEEVVA